MHRVPLTDHVPSSEGHIPVSPTDTRAPTGNIPSHSPSNGSHPLSLSLPRVTFCSPRSPTPLPHAPLARCEGTRRREAAAKTDTRGGSEDGHGRRQRRRTREAAAKADTRGGSEDGHERRQRRRTREAAAKADTRDGSEDGHERRQRRRTREAMKQGGEKQ